MGIDFYKSLAFLDLLKMGMDRWDKMELTV